MKIILTITLKYVGNVSGRNMRRRNEISIGVGHAVIPSYRETGKGLRVDGLSPELQEYRYTVADHDTGRRCLAEAHLKHGFILPLRLAKTPPNSPKYYKLHLKYWGIFLSPRTPPLVPAPVN